MNNIEETSFSAATVKSGIIQFTIVENKYTIRRRLKSLKKVLLKVPRWIFGKLRPKKQQEPDDEPKNDDLDEDDNELAAEMTDDRDDNSDNGVPAEEKAAEVLVPVPTYSALVKRGYTVKKHIGQGGYGSILLATSKRQKCQMAIKVVEKLSNGLTDESQMWSVLNEIKFADLFDHPYLNVYHAVIDTSKRTYMVMEYFPRGTLMDVYNRVDFTPELVAYEWFAQLCSALEYLHANGYSHRDVKLDNVLLDQQFRIRLADFGLSAAASPTILNVTVCGTKLYMSPELLAQIPYRGQSADVWAAGVLLFCLVTGRFPFLPAAPTNEQDEDICELILKSQRKGHSFNAMEKQRLSIECQSIFGQIFVKESDRPQIKDLKKHNWMVKKAQDTKK